MEYGETRIRGEKKVRSGTLIAWSWDRDGHYTPNYRDRMTGGTSAIEQCYRGRFGFVSEGTEMMAGAIINTDEAW